MYFVYLLQSEEDKRTYVGCTKNFENRLKLHNSGQVKATRNRRPLQMLFVEELKTEPEAKARERWWKNGSGRNKLKTLFNDK